MSTKNNLHDLLERVWKVTRYVDDRSEEVARTNRALRRLNEFYRYYLPEEPQTADDDLDTVEAYEAQADPALEKALAALNEDDQALVRATAIDEQHVCLARADPRSS